MTEQDLKFKIESYCKRKRNVKTKKNNIKAKGEAYENAMSYPSDAEVIYYSGESASHCRRLAKEADVVVIVAGNDYLDEGESILAVEWSENITDSLPEQTIYVNITPLSESERKIQIIGGNRF